MSGMVAYATRPISDLVAYCRRVSDLTRLLAEHVNLLFDRANDNALQ